MKAPIVGPAAHALAIEVLGCGYTAYQEEEPGHVSEKYDRRLVRLAQHVARSSKDPSTQTGAVLVQDRRVFSVGFNGFARGVDDDPARYADREVKYELVAHCEVNAVVLASRFGYGHLLEGCTLYTSPFMSCSRCAAVMIQAGVKRAVAPAIDPERAARWGRSVELARMQFREAGVELVELEGLL